MDEENRHSISWPAVIDVHMDTVDLDEAAHARSYGPLDVSGCFQARKSPA